MLALIYALTEEIKPLLKDFQKESVVSSGNTTLAKGKFQNNPIVFCRTGVGMGNTNEATKQLLGLYKPSLLISVGYCGGLQAGMKSGDLLLPTEIRSHTNDLFKPEEAARQKLSQIIEQEKITCHTGPLLSVFNALETAAKKKEAGKSGAVGVDMETAAIASVCEKVSIPFVSLRTVFDSVETELPISAEGKFLKGKFLSLPKMLLIHRKCQRNLNQVIEKYLQSGW